MDFTEPVTKLEIKDFEGLKLYDVNSPVTDVVGAKVRAVFEKLFQNSGIDSSDFHFLCFRDDSANAFFINKSKLQGGKNIVAVSDKMIMALDNEDELAAVIAHECGHFLWQKYIAGKNTIFQERWSDINSVDLMVNAGYNPRYILEMQKKVFGNFSHHSTTLNVHGTSFARAEDVKAYLTKRATEWGDFKQIKSGKNPEWAKYQTQVQGVLKDNVYNTFIEKKLIEKFGTKDLNKIKMADFLMLVLDLVHGYNIHSMYQPRVQDLIDKIENYNFMKIEKKEDIKRTSDEIDLLQRIFLQLHDNATYTDSLNTFLRVSRLKKFGPFLEQYNNIQNFMDSIYDEKELEIHAQKILDLEWTGSYTRGFNDNMPYPNYTPMGPDNVGKRLPSKQVWAYKNSVINRAANLLYTAYDVRASYKEEDNLEYYCGPDGVVLYYGEDAKKQYDKDLEENNRKRDKSTFDKNVAGAEDWIKYVDKFSDFASDKITGKEYIDWLLQQMAGKGQLIVCPYMYFDMFNSDVYQPEMIEIYKKILASRGYDYFVRCNDNPSERQNIFIDKTRDVNDIVDSINKSVGGHGYLRSVIRYRQFKEAQYKLIKYIVNNDTQIGMQDLYNMYMGLAGQNEHISPDSDIYKWKKQYELYSWASMSKTPVALQYRFPPIVAQDFEYKQESVVLKNIVQHLGFDYPIKSDEGLLFVLKTLQKHNAVYDNVAQMFIWADFLRHGGRVKITDVMQYIPKDTFGSGDAYNSDAVADVLGDFLQDADFNSLDLYDKIAVYEYLQFANLFSEKHANQNRYIRIIVDQIVKSPITDKVAVKYAENFLTRNRNTEYGNDFIRTDFEFYTEREKLIEFYANYWANELGRDDNSDDYLKHVDAFVAYINKPTNTNQNWFSSGIAKAIADRVSNKVMAQERAAEKIASVAHGNLNADAVGKYDIAVQAAEAAFGALASKPDAVIVMIDFLSKKMTDESVNRVLESVNKYPSVLRYINKSKLMMIHENFWGADLPLRAYMMNRLLCAYSDKDKDKLNLIVNMFFDEKSKYYKDAKLVLDTVYNNLQDYERNLIIAALASAGQRGDGDSVSGGQMVGRGLKMFLQNKGPAFIKFGQLLSYLPTLDTDIRQELATLRDKANVPQRDELFEIMKMSLPDTERQKISHVGKILGSGSFFITVQVKYENRDCVVALMRPHARELTESGVEMISGTVNDLARADKKFAPLKNIVAQARESAFSEIDIEQDYQKYLQAKSTYENIIVHTKTASYTPDVAQWFAYGADNSGANAYKIMEMAPGKTLANDDWTDAEKHDLAVAYVALELSLLLSGQRWDTDRHQGQQNFYDKSFRDFCIGVFDTGAQMNRSPNKKDKVMLGYLLYELATGVKNGENISDVLIKTVREIDSAAGKFNIDSSYIDGVQRGLTALSDIIEYQKEQKDEFGNVVVESRSLTAQDFQNIINAIQKSGLVDKTVEKTVFAKALLDKLMFWRKGLSGGDTSGVFGDELFVEYKNPEQQIQKAKKIVRAESEIQHVIQEQKDKDKFGIGKWVSGPDVGDNVSLV